MIKLEVEEYCDDCPEFDAHVEKEVLFAGYSKKKIFDNYRKTGQLEMMSDDNIDDWEDTK